MANLKKVASQATITKNDNCLVPIWYPEVFSKNLKKEKP